MKNKKGQIWIETVLYTLIILALIGLVLAFVSPRIEKEKDEIIIEQTIASLNVLDEKINVVLEDGVNNRRVVEFGMSRGELFINSSEEKIIFVLKELKEPYTEPDVEVEFGRITIVTTEGKKTNSVSLTLDYSTIANVSFAGDSELNEKFSPTSRPYRFSIENLGRENSLFDIVNIDLVS